MDLNTSSDAQATWTDHSPTAIVFLLFKLLVLFQLSNVRRFGETHLLNEIVKTDHPPPTTPSSFFSGAEVKISHKNPQ